MHAFSGYYSLKNYPNPHATYITQNQWKYIFFYFNANPWCVGLYGFTGGAFVYQWWNKMAAALCIGQQPLIAPPLVKFIALTSLV